MEPPTSALEPLQTPRDTSDHTTDIIQVQGERGEAANAPNLPACTVPLPVPLISSVPEVPHEDISASLVQPESTAYFAPTGFVSQQPELHTERNGSFENAPVVAYHANANSVLPDADHRDGLALDVPVKETAHVDSADSFSKQLFVNSDPERARSFLEPQLCAATASLDAPADESTLVDARSALGGVADVTQSSVIIRAQFEQEHEALEAPLQLNHDDDQARASCYQEIAPQLISTATGPTGADSFSACARMVIQFIGREQENFATAALLLPKLVKFARHERRNGTLTGIVSAPNLQSTESSVEAEVNIETLVCLLLASFVRPAVNQRWIWNETSDSSESVLSIERAIMAATVCAQLSLAYCESASLQVSSTFSIEHVLEELVGLVSGQISNFTQFFEIRSLEADDTAGYTKRAKPVPFSCDMSFVEKTISHSVSLLEMMTEILYADRVRFNDKVVRELVNCGLKPLFLSDDILFHDDQAKCAHLMQSASISLVESAFCLYPQLRSSIIEDLAVDVGTGVLPVTKTRLNFRSTEIDTVPMESPGLRVKLGLSPSDVKGGDAIRAGYVLVLLLRCLQACVNGATAQSGFPIDSPHRPKKQRRIAETSTASSFGEDSTTSIILSTEAFKGLDVAKRLAADFFFRIYTVCTDRSNPDHFETSKRVAQYLEFMVSELLVLAFMPEWPAAEIALHALSALLAQGISTKDNSPDRAIGWLGTITADLLPRARSAMDPDTLKSVRVRPVKEPARDESAADASMNADPASSASIANDDERHSSEAHYCICRSSVEVETVLCDRCGEWFHFRCVGFDAEAALDEAFEEEEWHCASCVTWSSVSEQIHALVDLASVDDVLKEKWRESLRLRAVVANYLYQRECASELVSDARAMWNARVFALAVWHFDDQQFLRKSGHAGDLPKALRAWYAENTIRCVPQNTPALQVSSRDLSHFSQMIERFPTFSSRKEVIDASIVLGAGRPLLHHVSSAYFVKLILEVLLPKEEVLDQLSARAPDLGTRTCIFTTLKRLCESSPSLLEHRAISQTVRKGFQDNAADVRKAVLRLVGYQIFKNDSLSEDFLDAILARLHDTHSSVRLQSVNILHDMVISNPLHPRAGTILQHLAALSISLYRHRASEDDGPKRDRKDDEKAESHATAAVGQVLFSCSNNINLKLIDGDHKSSQALVNLKPEDRTRLLLELCAQADLPSLPVDAHTREVEYDDSTLFIRNFSGGESDDTFYSLTLFLSRSLETAAPLPSADSSEMFSRIFKTVISWIDDHGAQLHTVVDGCNTIPNSRSDRAAILHAQSNAAISLAKMQYQLLNCLFCLTKISNKVLCQGEILEEFISRLVFPAAALQEFASLTKQSKNEKLFRSFSMAMFVRWVDTLSCAFLSSSSVSDIIDQDQLTMFVELLKKQLTGPYGSPKVFAAAVRCWSILVHGTTHSYSDCEDFFVKFLMNSFVFLCGELSRTVPAQRTSASSNLQQSISKIASQLNRSIVVTALLSRYFDWDSILAEPCPESELQRLAMREFLTEQKPLALRKMTEALASYTDLTQDLELRQRDHTEFCVSEVIAMILFELMNDLASLLQSVQDSNKPNNGLSAQLAEMISRCIDGLHHCAKRNPVIILAVTPRFEPLLLGSDDDNDIHDVLQQLGEIPALGAPAVRCFAVSASAIKATIFRTLAEFLTEQEHTKMQNQGPIFDDADCDGPVQLDTSMTESASGTDIPKAISASSSGPLIVALLSRHREVRLHALKLLAVMRNCGLLTKTQLWLPYLLALQFDDEVDPSGGALLRHTVSEISFGILSSISEKDPHIGQFFDRKGVILPGLELARGFRHRLQAQGVPMSCFVRTGSNGGANIVRMPSLTNFYSLLCGISQPKKSDRLKLLDVLVSALSPIENVTLSPSRRERSAFHPSMIKWIAECCATLPFKYELEVMHLIYQCSKALSLAGDAPIRQLKKAANDSSRNAWVADSVYRLIIIAYLKKIVKIHFNLTDARCEKYDPLKRTANLGPHTRALPLAWDASPFPSDQPPSGSSTTSCAYLTAAWKSVQTRAKDFTNATPKAAVRKQKRRRSLSSPRSPVTASCKRPDSDDDFVLT